MSKPDDQLRSEIEVDENRAELGALAVLAGLVLEVLFALARSVEHEIKPPAVENWGTVVADSLVALGVAAEVLFSRKARRASEELTRRSDERLAEANVRAAEAEMRTEQLRKELAWRRLSKQEVEKIGDILSKSDLPKCGLRIFHAPSDPEAITFARDIADAFRNNGWSVLFMATTMEILPGVMIPLYPPPDLDACGIARAAIGNAGIEFAGGTPPATAGMLAASGDDISGPSADMYIGSKAAPKLDWEAATISETTIATGMR
jgi:hypothetical protein